MQDKIIIGFVVVVVLGAHAWLFLWIKFKIDEGAIIKFLKESEDENCGSVEKMATATAIPVARVASICTKSKAIKKQALGKQLWVVE